MVKKIIGLFLAALGFILSDKGVFSPLNKNNILPQNIGFMWILLLVIMIALLLISKDRLRILILEILSIISSYAGIYFSGTAHSGIFCYSDLSCKYNATSGVLIYLGGLLLLYDYIFSIKDKDSKIKKRERLKNKTSF